MTLPNTADAEHNNNEFGFEDDNDNKAAKKKKLHKEYDFYCIGCNEAHKNSRKQSVRDQNGFRVACAVANGEYHVFFGRSNLSSLCHACCLYFKDQRFWTILSDILI